MRHATAGIRWGWVVAAGLGLATVGLEGQPMTTPKTIGSLIKADPRFDTLIAPGHQDRGARRRLRLVRRAAVGQARRRLPAVLRHPANSIMKWTPGQAAPPFMKPSGYTGVAKYGGEPGSNGLTLDKQGRLILGRARRPPRRPPRLDGRQADARRQLPGQAAQQPQRRRRQVERRPLLHRPALRPARAARRTTTRETRLLRRLPLVAKTGEVTLLTKEMSRPNGLAFSPDEKTLYVANSDPAKRASGWRSRSRTTARSAPARCSRT